MVYALRGMRAAYAGTFSESFSGTCREACSATGRGRGATFLAGTECALPSALSGGGEGWRVAAVGVAVHGVPATEAGAMGRKAHRAKAKASILVFKMSVSNRMQKYEIQLRKALL